MSEFSSHCIMNPEEFARRIDQMEHVSEMAISELPVYLLSKTIEGVSKLWISETTHKWNNMLLSFWVYEHLSMLAQYLALSLVF